MTMLDRLSIHAAPSRVEIYRDEFVPSKPWKADLVFDNGTRWKSWQHNFKTQKEMLTNITAVNHNLPIERVADA